MKKYSLLLIILICTQFNITAQCPKGASLTLNNTRTLTNTTFLGDVYIVNNTITSANPAGTGDIVITLKGMIKLKNNAFIYVQKGTKLILDNATLTSQCVGTLWGGIRVQGNIANQFLGYPMGRVLVLNSTVENATIAIKNDNSAINKGGKVECYNSSFINNIADLDLYPEFWEWSTATYATSYFVDNCKFISNISTRNYSSHISVLNSSLNIKNSKFDHTVNFPNLTPNLWKPCINATDAMIESYGNIFDNVNIGINTKYIANYRMQYIKENGFRNNNRGIITNSASAYTEITKNYMNTSYVQSNWSNIKANSPVIGFSITGQSNIDITNNGFYPYNANPGGGLLVNNIGVELNNIGTRNTRFHNNRALELSTLMISNGKNNATGLFGSSTGLYFTCNNLYMNSGAAGGGFSYFRIDPNNTIVTNGVRKYIAMFNSGSSIIGASGNTFCDGQSPSYGKPPVYTTVKNNTNWITYYHRNFSNLCDYDIPQIPQRTRTVVLPINSCNYVTPPTDPLPIRPYDKEINTNILSAAQRSEIQSELSGFNQLHASLLTQLQNTISLNTQDEAYRENLRAEISVLKGEIDLKTTELKKDILVRELVNNEDLYSEFYTCVSNYGTEEKLYEIFGYKMNKNLYDDALSTLNQIAMECTLTDEEIVALSDLKTLTSLIKSVRESNRDLKDLTPTELIVVQNIANSSLPSRAKYRACNWSEYVTEEKCLTEEVYDFWENTDNITKTTSVAKINSNVYPNPAKNQITLNYEPNTDNTEQILTVYSIDGKCVLENKLDNQVSKKVINVIDWAPSTYYYIIKENNEIKARNSFVIVK